MSDRIFEKSIELMLAKAGEAAELAWTLYDVLQGDVGEEVGELLHRYGYVDENYKWKNIDD